MPPQARRFAVVTGANSGFGYAAARQLLCERGHDVVLACRHVDAGRAALQEMAPPADAFSTVMAADFADLASVEAFARAFVVAFPHRKLDVLILNHGVAKLTKELTKEGFECASHKEKCRYHNHRLSLT